MTSFDNLNNSVLPYFEETAKELIEKYSATGALARALAIISGYTKSLKQKSMLNSMEGMVTLQVSGDIPNINRGSYAVLKLFREIMDPMLVNNIKTMKMIRNNGGVVFDVRDEQKEAFLALAPKLKQDEGIILELCRELPDLIDVGGYGGGGYGRGNYGRNGGGGSWGRNNSRGYNNRRGGGGNSWGRNNYGGGNNNSWGRHNNNDQGFGSGGVRRFTNSRKQDGSGGNSWGRNGNNNSGNNSSWGRNGGGNSWNRGGGNDSNRDSRKLFIGNLPFDIRQNKFEEWIKSRNVQASDSYLVKDQEGNCRGFGYIKFNDSNETEKAMKMLSNCYINERRVKVDYATEKNN